MYKRTFAILVISAVTFFLAIAYSVNNAQAQETVSKSVATMGGVDSYDVSETNIVYNFNELSLFSTWYYIQYPYARFTPYPSGYFRVNNQVSDYSYYTNYITNDYPYYNFGGVDVQFTQSVRNLSFTTVGVNGGNFKVDIYQNGTFTQQVTIPAVCFGYENCFTDLRGWQNLTRISIHSINDPAGLGFDDFSFTLGGTPTPTPTPQNQAPIGYLDVVREDGLAMGWTLDPNNQNVSNPVHFYVDGTSSAHFVGGMVASMSRQDLILAGYQGQHGFEFSLPERFKDGNPHTLYVYGLDLTTGQPPTLLTGTPKTFTLHSVVQSVAFQQITNETINGEPTNSEVDRPVYGPPSQRIFPDKKFPEDTVNHKRVRVKAVVGKPNINVYFRNFDVDDPSSDNTIDDTGSNGNDNREGRIIGQPYPQTAAGILSGLPCPNASNCVMSSTNANGEAIVYFTVTKQPGDNFRIAASTDETYLNGVKVAGTELADATNIPLSNTGKAKQTELLTVWRKLYMEVDSMGEVAGNFVTGFFAGKGTYIGSQAKWIEIYCPTLLDEHGYKQTLQNDNDESTRLSYGGRIVFAGVHSLQVLDSRPIYNSLNNIKEKRQEILVQSLNGNIYLRTNHPFKLYDDDDFNESDDFLLMDGDNGENVDLLDDTLSRMRDNDNVNENAYAAAYIKPEYQWAQGRGLNDTDVPFELHSIASMFQDGREHRPVINNYRGSKIFEQDDFWIGYLLVAYQEGTRTDTDSRGAYLGVAPYKEDNTRGITDVYDQNLGVPPGSIGAIIWIEVIRDYALKPLPPIGPLDQPVTMARIRTAPHEIGHQFGISHNDNSSNGGIMSYSGDLFFSNNHINMMRWRVKSPGEGD
jgi:hypothetical protein